MKKGSDFHFTQNSACNDKQRLHVTYSPHSTENYFSDDALPQFKFSDQYSIAFISSRCVKKREKIVSELAKYIPIYSLGNCKPENTLRISSLKECKEYSKSQSNRDISKKCLLKQFKFNLAIENTFEDDYVTEKFFDNFDLPIVPVYFGARNIDLYAPGENSFINGWKYTPMELANYLIKMDLHEYLKYFEWKIKKKINPNYQYSLNHSRDHVPCSFCEYLANFS
jgi:hypothetical protein